MGAPTSALLCASGPETSFCQHTVFCQQTLGRWQTNQAFHRKDTSNDLEKNCHHLLHAHRYSVFCFCHWLSEKNICRTHFVHLHIQRQRQAPQAHRARQCWAFLTHRAASPFAYRIPPSEIWPNIQHVFYSTGSSTQKKGSAKPPSSLTASRHPLRAASTRTLWTIQAQRADTQFLRDQVGPQNINIRAPHFPSSSFSLTPIIDTLTMLIVNRFANMLLLEVPAVLD